jgi:tRNA pseudouridine55 synthase
MSKRRRKGRAISGWLALDKPAGITSTRALSEVKRLFDAAKAGHAGTLDPIASGILPIALGDATKTVPFVMDSRKVYRFTVRWGSETTTDDTEGTPSAYSDRRPGAEEIAAMLPRFTGEIMQAPPAFSAVKIEGERAYDLARGGEELEMEPRPVTVHSLTLVARPDDDTAIFEAECGKGTYVRAIARDLGRALGTCGHVTALRRLAVGPFDEAAAVEISALREAAEADGPEGCARFLSPIVVALGDIAAVTVGNQAAMRIARGQPVLIRGAQVPPPGPAYAISEGRPIAIGEVEAGEFRPKRVFGQGS